MSTETKTCAACDSPIPVGTGVEVAAGLFACQRCHKECPPPPVVPDPNLGLSDDVWRHLLSKDEAAGGTKP